MWGTRGTETSKYPEEEKENLSISRVAASEMEGAQTGMRAFRGYGPQEVTRKIEEWHWESQPQRVKAPYSKSEGSERNPKYYETRGTL